MIQYSKGQKVDYFLGIGTNLTYLHQKISTENNSESYGNGKMTLGPNLGLRLDYHINKYLDASSGLNYIYKSSTNLKLHYLSLPVLIRIIPFEKFSFDFGGDIERLIYANQDGQNVTYLFYKIDCGLIGGFNYQFCSRLEFSVQYYNSLKKFYATYTYIEHADYYNRSFLLMIDYNITKK